MGQNGFFRNVLFYLCLTWNVLSQFWYKQNNQFFLSLPIVFPLKRTVLIGGNVYWNCSTAKSVDTAGIIHEMANQFTVWTWDLTALSLLTST